MIKDYWIDVTPDVAKEILMKNNRNRKLNIRRVREYAQLMEEGRWREHHQGIAIYEDGELADGQTRLHAIIESGKSFKMRVSYGIPKEAGLYIDDHKARTAIDTIRIGTGDRWFNTTNSAIIRMFQIVKGHYNRRLTSDLLLELATDEVREKIDFSVDITPKVIGIRSSPFFAAIATAYGNVSDERLIDFCDIIKTGMCVVIEDIAAIRLREFVIANVKTINSTTACKRDYFLRVQNAIRYFSRGEKVKRLHAAKKLVYDLII